MPTCSYLVIKLGLQSVKLSVTTSKCLAQISFAFYHYSTEEPESSSLLKIICLEPKVFHLAFRCSYLSLIYTNLLLFRIFTIQILCLVLYTYHIHPTHHTLCFFKAPTYSTSLICANLSLCLI